MSISLNKPSIGSTGWGTDVNNNWTTLENGIREKLSAAKTYYVATTGSDSNNGLSAGSPFLTIQKAIDVASALDNGGYNITIRLSDGTYTGTNILRSFVGSGSISIVGNTGTPDNVVISTTSAHCFSGLNVTGTYIINSLKMQTTTSGSCIVAQGGSTVIAISGVNFGAVAAGHYQIYIGSCAYIYASSNYSISGGGGFHVYCTLSAIYAFQGKTVTISDTPAFTAFVQGYFGGNILAQGAAFSGGATGQRYNADTNSNIYTNGGGANFFPGNSAGATTNGGTYT